MHRAKKKKSNERKKEKPMASSGPHKRPMGIPEGMRKKEQWAGGCVTSMATQCVCHLFGFYVALL